MINCGCTSREIIHRCSQHQKKRGSKRIGILFDWLMRSFHISHTLTMLERVHPHALVVKEMIVYKRIWHMCSRRALRASSIPCTIGPLVSLFRSLLIIVRVDVTRMIVRCEDNARARAVREGKETTKDPCSLTRSHASGGKHKSN